MPKGTEQLETPETVPPTEEVDTTATPAGPKQEATLTQEQVDTIAGRARIEAREAARTALLAELGIEDINTAKAELARLAEIDNANRSEAERLQVQLDAADAAKQAAETAAAEARSALRQAHIDRQLDGVLTAAKAQHTDDLVLILRNKHGDDLAACFDDAGLAVGEKLTGFITGIKPKYPHFFGSVGGGSPSNSGGIIPGDVSEAKVAAMARIRELNRA